MPPLRCAVPQDEASIKELFTQWKLRMGVEFRDAAEARLRAPSPLCTDQPTARLSLPNTPHLSARGPPPSLQDSRRYSVFVENLKTIIANNNDPTVLHWSGLTPLAATTAEEVSGRASAGDAKPAARRMLRLVHTTPAARRQAQALASALSGAALPANKDWREAGIVTPVKFQDRVGRVAERPPATGCLPFAA